MGIWAGSPLRTSGDIWLEEEDVFLPRLIAALLWSGICHTGH